MSDEGNLLGRWVGARVQGTWTVSLNVEGAEESEYFDEYDQAFDGSLIQCLDKLKEYHILIKENIVPAYLGINWNLDPSGTYIYGDYEHVLEEMLDLGYISSEEYKKYSQYV